MYPTFMRTFRSINFYSWMPFLTSTRITDQESDPLVAFYDRMAVLLFSTRQSMVVCNKISSDET